MIPKRMAIRSVTQIAILVKIMQGKETRSHVMHLGESIKLEGTQHVLHPMLFMLLFAKLVAFKVLDQPLNGYHV